MRFLDRLFNRKYYKHEWEFPYSKLTQYDTDSKMPSFGLHAHPRQFFGHEGLWPKYSCTEVTREEYDADGRT